MAAEAPEAPRDTTHRVVIVGGGFAGLNAARALRREPVDVVLVDRTNHHLFQPLLYQVATGGLAAPNIAAPLRNILRRERNVSVRMAEVTGFDVEGRRVLIEDGALPYDTLIVAAGMENHYFGHESWQRHAPGLKTLDDAMRIRNRVLRAFEHAEHAGSADAARAWLTFVIVGGGPTGAELAGTLADIARTTLRNEFRHIDPGGARVILVEGESHILSTYPEHLSESAVRALEKLGVEVRLNTLVSDIEEDRVELRSGDGTETVLARTTVWAAGVKASPLAEQLADATGAETDGAGRLHVEPDLSISGHPEILVLGDMAHAVDEDGVPLPGVAPVAIQQGRYAARLIRDRLRDRETKPFHYLDLGSMATLGRKAAIADLRFTTLTGLPAWLAWLFVHLFWLVTFANRVLVLLQWAWNYVTFGRPARIITKDYRAR